MGFLDPITNLIQAALEPLMNVFSSVLQTMIKGLVSPLVTLFGSIVFPLLKTILQSIINVFVPLIGDILNPFLSLSQTLFKAFFIDTLLPLIKISGGIVTQTIIDLFKAIVPDIVNTIMMALFPGSFNETDKKGFDWICNLIMDIGFVAGYFIFLFGYAFIMRFGVMVIQFLPISMILTLLIVPFVPLAYFIYICVSVIKLKFSDFSIIFFISQISEALTKTRKFFVDNLTSILIKYAYLFLYQVFLFIYDMIKMLPPIDTQLSKLGIAGQIIMNIIIYYPIWWFFYSFFVEKKNVNDIPNRILGSMDSVINTFKNAYNWIIRKTTGIIKVFTK